MRKSKAETSAYAPASTAAAAPASRKMVCAAAAAEVARGVHGEVYGARWRIWTRGVGRGGGGFGVSEAEERGRLVVVRRRKR